MNALNRCLPRRSRNLVLMPIAAWALVGSGAVFAQPSTPWPAQCTLASMPAVSGFGGVSDPPPALVEAAKAEGQVVLYSAITETGSMDAIVAAFGEAYPGVTLSWTSAGGLSQRRARFLAEAEAAQPAADIITDVSKGFFADAFAKGYLVPLDEVVEGFSGTWPKDLQWGSDAGQTGVLTFSPFGFAYNSQQVPAELVPTTWEDLAKPEYKGHIQIKDINASANTADHFQFLRETLGDELFAAFAANLNPTPLHADAQIMAQELAAGGAWVMPQAQPNVIDTIAQTGAPVASVVPDTVGGTQYSIGVAANAPHPNAAALFAYWSFSPGGQWVTACAMRSGTPVFPAFGPANFSAYSSTSEEELAQLNTAMGLTP